MPSLPTHANLDTSICLTPGLFRSIKRGTRRSSLLVRYPKVQESEVGLSEVDSRETFTFVSPVLLGADDLRVLQGVFAYVDRDRRKIRGGMPGGLGKLHDRLRMGGFAENKEAILVSSSYAELARAVGYGQDGGGGVLGGGIARKIQTSLDRFAGLSVTWQLGDRRGSWQYLSWDDGGTRQRRLRVALNPRSGASALGLPPYARIDLGVARRLKSDGARLLHQRLSAWAGGEGEPKKIGLEALIRYPWMSDDPGADCLRKRRWTMKRIIDELNDAGWDIKVVPGHSEKWLVSSGSDIRVTKRSAQRGVGESSSKKRLAAY